MGLYQFHSPLAYGYLPTLAHLHANDNILKERNTPGYLGGPLYREGWITVCCLCVPFRHTTNRSLRCFMSSATVWVHTVQGRLAAGFPTLAVSLVGRGHMLTNPCTENSSAQHRMAQHNSVGHGTFGICYRHRNPQWANCQWFKETQSSTISIRFWHLWITHKIFLPPVVQLNLSAELVIPRFIANDMGLYDDTTVWKSYWARSVCHTGLDPAEPYFQGCSELVRLDPSDAKFVDTIHTDSLPMIPYIGMFHILPGTYIVG